MKCLKNKKFKIKAVQNKIKAYNNKFKKILQEFLQHQKMLTN